MLSKGNVQYEKEVGYSGI